MSGINAQVPVHSRTMINVRGIWRKVANLWPDEQKPHEDIVKDKAAQQVKVQ